MRIQTLVFKYQENGELDLPRLEGIRDVSFWNPTAAGTSNTATLLINGVPLDLLPGDPILSFGGYENAYRNDVIQISFAGAGVNNLIVFANKVIS